MFRESPYHITVDRRSPPRLETAQRQEAARAWVSEVINCPKTLLSEHFSNKRQWTLCSLIVTKLEVTIALINRELRSLRKPFQFIHKTE